MKKTRHTEEPRLTHLPPPSSGTVNHLRREHVRVIGGAQLRAKTGDGNFLCTVAESVLQIIMEADVDGLIGAGQHERSGERSTWRNGYRDRTLDERLGTLNLKIPKLRTGSYFPGVLEPRKTVEKALVAVIQEAWIVGVSTRRVDELVQAMGMLARPEPLWGVVALLPKGSCALG